MAQFPAFPRFPYLFDSNVTATLYRIIADWATATIEQNNQADIVLQQRKVEKDNAGSIEISGRIKVGDVSTVDPREGDIRYNSTTNKFQGYDGTAWRDFH